MPSKKPQEPKPQKPGVMRDAHGRLLPGTAGISPGRPTREREQELLGIMREEVTPVLWRQITRRAIVDAAAGDSASRAWLSKYLLPTPTQPVAVEGTLADLITALSRPDA